MLRSVTIRAMSFKKILGYYAPHMWRFRYPIGGTFLAYGIAVLFKDVLGALVYKHLFDTLGMGAATPDAVVTK